MPIPGKARTLLGSLVHPHDARALHEDMRDFAAAHQGLQVLAGGGSGDRHSVPTTPQAVDKT